MTAQTAAAAVAATLHFRNSSGASTPVSTGTPSSSMSTSTPNDGSALSPLLDDSFTKPQNAYSSSPLITQRKRRIPGACDICKKKKSEHDDAETRFELFTHTTRSSM
jgi:hypothetical protein